MAQTGDSGHAEWEILLTAQVEAFLDLLVAGDKSGQWIKWYRTAIPRAEQLYDEYLADRMKEAAQLSGDAGTETEAGGP